MPLETGRSKAALSHNISTERAAGKPERQAVAISFAQQRRGDAFTKAIGTAGMTLPKRQSTATPEDIDWYTGWQEQKERTQKYGRRPGESEKDFKSRAKYVMGEKPGGRGPPMTSVTAKRKLLASKLGVKPTVRRDDALHAKLDALLTHCASRGDCK